MKHNTTRLMTFSGLTVFLGTATAFGVLAQNSPSIVTPGPRMGQGTLKGEKHPELRKALKILERAQDALQHAAHDFDGHREKAIDLTQKAIKEVQIALASDKK